MCFITGIFFNSLNNMHSSRPSVFQLINCVIFGNNFSLVCFQTLKTNVWRKFVTLLLLFSKIQGSHVNFRYNWLSNNDFQCLKSSLCQFKITGWILSGMIFQTKMRLSLRLWLTRLKSDLKVFFRAARPYPLVPLSLEALWSS